MKKSKILLSALSMTAIAPVLPMVFTSCGTKDTAVSYDVNLFTTDGGQLAGGQTTFNVNQGTKWKDVANKPTPTPKDGYKFGGWYRGETLITDDTVINDNMDIYAWFEKEQSSQIYVSLLVGPGGNLDGASIVPALSGTKWGNIKNQLGTATANDGYKFIGYYMNDKLINDDTIIDSNSYIFAWFEPENTNQCSIKFVAMAGGELDSAYIVQKIDKGTKFGAITKPTTKSTADGYNFEGWYINNVKPEEETEINETVYCFAYFEKTDVTVKIDNTGLEHGSVVTAEPTLPVGYFNVKRTELDKCVKPDSGYVLGGWQDENGDLILDNYKLETDKTIKPVFVEECNNYEYNTENHTAKITSRIQGKEQTNLMVPAYVWKDGDTDPYKIVSINENYYLDVTTLATACLPDTITSVPKRAFKNCRSLNTLILPKTITYIGYETFYMANFQTSLNKFYFLGTKDEFANVSKESWWCEGIKNKTCICTDGVVSFS